jgi:alpha-acetolactate decarboxylase
MFRPSLVLAGVVFTACATPPSPAAHREGSMKVRTYGALRAMMHEGQTGPQVSLPDLRPGSHSYGVGALSELRGEVTILDDTVWLAYPGDDGKARVETVRASDEKAALLVVASVPAWKAVTLDEDVPFDSLDKAVETLAQNQNLDINEAFPVVIEGAFANLSAHVIDGRKISADAHSHQEHMRTALRTELAAATGTLVGFFSKHHHGVFTHMGSNTHFHVVLPGEKITGHVDQVLIRRGSTLKLPAQ